MIIDVILLNGQIYAWERERERTGLYTQEENKLTVTAERPLRDCWNKFISWAFLELSRAASYYAISVPLWIDHISSATGEREREEELICVTFSPSLARAPLFLPSISNWIFSICHHRSPSFNNDEIETGNDISLQRCSAEHLKTSDKDREKGDYVTWASEGKTNPFGQRVNRRAHCPLLFSLSLFISGYLNFKLALTITRS